MPHENQEQNILTIVVGLVEAAPRKRVWLKEPRSFWPACQASETTKLLLNIILNQVLSAFGGNALLLKDLLDCMTKSVPASRPSIQRQN
jgi:hypothetical protein